MYLRKCHRLAIARTQRNTRGRTNLPSSPWPRRTRVAGDGGSDAAGNDQSPGVGAAPTDNVHGQTAAAGNQDFLVGSVRVPWRSSELPSSGKPSGDRSLVGSGPSSQGRMDRGAAPFIRRISWRLQPELPCSFGHFSSGFK
jgi:hypothetical protein